MLLTSQGIKAAQEAHQDKSEPGSIEELKHILALKQRREVSFNEAQEVGRSLVEFYQILAEEIPDEPDC